MSKLTTFCGIAVSAILCLTPLSAQADGHSGSMKDSPSYAPQFNWTGAYVGAHLGYGWGDSATTATSNGAFDDPASLGYTIDSDTDGWFGGGQIGYNWQTGSLVFGVEMDVGYLGTDGDKFNNPGAPAGLTDTAIETDYGWYGVAALRVGLATNQTLFYIKGGAALADIDHRSGDLDPDAPGPTQAFDVSDTTTNGGAEWGYVIGGGLEYAMNNKWTLKGEYLYMDFGSTGSSDPEGNTYDTDHHLHTFKIGMNYRF